VRHGAFLCGHTSVKHFAAVAVGVACHVCAVTFQMCDIPLHTCDMALDMCDMTRSYVYTPSVT